MSYVSSGEEQPNDYDGEAALEVRRSSLESNQFSMASVMAQQAQVMAFRNAAIPSCVGVIKLYQLLQAAAVLLM